MGQRKKRPTPVLLIHGIASEGEWQDEVSATLKPFFAPAQVRYPQYRGRFGALKVVCETRIAALAAVILLVMLWAGVPTWPAVAIAAVVLFVACLKPFLAWRFGEAMTVYKQESGKVLERRPHVIAHSFGTRLTASLLEVMKGSRLGRIVLCGCVLPRTFDWHRYILADRVTAVRNDYTRTDWVGWAAKLAGGLHSHLGNAGTHGFHANAVHVHQVNSPEIPCTRCKSRQTKAHIHDVDCTGLGHSDGLTVESHCKMWWLPFLWGFDAAEHQDLVNPCRNWVDAGDDPEALEPHETEVAQRVWNWCHRATLSDYIGFWLTKAGLANDPTQVNRALYQLLVKINEASDAPLDDEIVECLNPRTAMTQVVEQAKELQAAV